MLVFVGLHRLEKALKGEHAGVVLQGFDQPFIHSEGGAQRFVEQLRAGVNQVDQVAQGQAGVPRHRQGDRQLNGVAVLTGVLALLWLRVRRCGRFLGLLWRFGRLTDALEARRAKRLQHRLDLFAVGAVAELQRAVPRDGEVVDLVGVGGRAHVLGLRAGRLRDDLDHRLALLSGYIVVNPHGRILLCFFPGFPWGSVYITLNRKNSKRISRHLSEKSHITLMSSHSFRHPFPLLSPGRRSPASCRHAPHTPDQRCRNLPRSDEG